MKKFNKLVRDKIPQIIERNGDIPVTRTLDDEEYIEELNKKLKEEINEYLESGEVEELCDVEEVILAILSYKKISLEDFENKRNKKVSDRGAFTKRIFLERTFPNNT